MLSSSSSTPRRSSSLMTGRCSPLSRRMLASVLTPTTSRSPCFLANWKYFTCPRWIRSKQPLVKTIRRPAARWRSSSGRSCSSVRSLAEQCSCASLSSSWMISSRRDRDGAELLDLQPRGDVRQRDRLRPARAPAARATASIASTMSPAPATSYTFRSRPAHPVPASPSRVGQVRAALVERDDRGLQPQVGQQPLGRGPPLRLGRLGVPADGELGRPLGLDAVGRDRRGAGVLGVVGNRRRVHQHRHAARLAAAISSLQTSARQQPLVVILEADGPRPSSARSNAARTRRPAPPSIGVVSS